MAEVVGEVEVVEVDLVVLVFGVVFVDGGGGGVVVGVDVDVGFDGYSVDCYYVDDGSDDYYDGYDYGYVHYFAHDLLPLILKWLKLNVVKVVEHEQIMMAVIWFHYFHLSHFVVVAAAMIVVVAMMCCVVVAVAAVAELIVIMLGVIELFAVERQLVDIVACSMKLQSN